MRRLLPALAVAAATTGCWLLASLADVDAGVDAAGDAQALDAGDASEAADGGGCQTAYRDNVLLDQPVIYLRLGELSGPTAVDEKGLHNGVYADAGITHGVPGAILTDPTNTAVAFNGGGITVPASGGFELAPNVPYTIELWAKQATWNDGSGFVIDHEGYGDAGVNNRWGWNVQIGYQSAFAERRLAPSSYVSGVGVDGGLSLAAYHHLVFTYDPTGTGTFCVYLDGARNDCSLTAGSDITASNLPWTIGVQGCQCSPNGFVGALDEIAVYPSALSADRISCHYHSALGN